MGLEKLTAPVPWVNLSSVTTLWPHLGRVWTTAVVEGIRRGRVGVKSRENAYSAFFYVEVCVCDTEREMVNSRSFLWMVNSGQVRKILNRGLWTCLPLGYCSIYFISARLYECNNTTLFSRIPTHYGENEKEIVMEKIFQTLSCPVC